MSPGQERRRGTALERLAANIAERLGNGEGPTFSQRMEYNALKAKLGEHGRLV